MNEKTNLNRITCMDAGLFYLGFRDRSETELRQYLLRKGYPGDEIDSVINRLTELGYINDYNFALRYAQAKSESNHYSKKQIIYKLVGLGVDRETITRAIEFIDDSDQIENAVLAGRKCLNRIQKYPVNEQKQRMSQTLLAKGFTYSVISTAVEILFKEDV